MPRRLLKNPLLEKPHRADVLLWASRRPKVGRRSQKLGNFCAIRPTLQIGGGLFQSSPRAADGRILLPVAESPLPSIASSAALARPTTVSQALAMSILLMLLCNWSSWPSIGSGWGSLRKQEAVATEEQGAEGSAPSILRPVSCMVHTDLCRPPSGGLFSLLRSLFIGLRYTRIIKDMESIIPDL